MIQEDKELLLKDLSSRLLYGVKCDVNDNKPYTLSSISNDYDDILIRFKEQKNGLNMEVYLSEVKPYLFPISSMNKKQRKYIRENHTFGATYELFDWLNKNHFDYRGLIEKRLAIDCTNLNIY